MIKEFHHCVDKVINLIFEPEPNDAQLDTLLFLAKKVYIKMGLYPEHEAEYYARCKVSEWVDKGRTEWALKGLWQRKIA